MMVSGKKTSEDSCAVLILAAGQGKRMGSTLPKVLHQAAGQPMLFHILDQALLAFPGAPLGVIVGHGKDQVEKQVLSEPRYQGVAFTFIHQPEQKGTGHAVQCAVSSKEFQASLLKSGAKSVLVLPGDCPLMTAELLREVGKPLPSSAPIRLLSALMEDPTGYGRVVRDESGQKTVQRIVEQKDASEAQKAIREVGLSIYLFDFAFLQKHIGTLSPQNAQGEYYLTDLIERATQVGTPALSLIWPTPNDVRGVNNPWELAEVNRVLHNRVIKAHCMRGVRFVDPQLTWVDAQVQIEPDVVIYPNVHLEGKTTIQSGTVVGPNCVLKNVQVGLSVTLRAGVVAEDSVIEQGAAIGPYAHFRPGSRVGAEAKIGNFVELKNTQIGPKTAVAHLSYLGDAEVGARVNIGCGFITCNFDGREINGSRKHKTLIEDDVFMGSDCQTLAPVRVGRGAYVASGSTVSEDVEADSLAIARSRQVNKPGYAKKLRGEEKK